MSTDENEDRLKFALLSVYYAAAGDRFNISGAPSAIVPPEIAPLPLDKALAVLKDDPNRLNQAIWQLVRNSPIRQDGDEDSRYPAEVDPYLPPPDQLKLDRIRSDYRAGASLLAAGLRACHHNDKSVFKLLLQAASNREIIKNPGFKRAVGLLYGEKPKPFVKRMKKLVDDDEQWQRERASITELEAEVALGIVTYVERLADTAAYEEFMGLGNLTENQLNLPLSALPVTTTITQSSSQLWTSATVTTLATGTYDAFLAATRPDHWQDGSDVVGTSHFVTDPFTLTKTEPAGPDDKLPALLYEVASMYWGQERGQRATFQNVLNVSREIKTSQYPDRPAIHIKFSLCRSIDSSVLWDYRPGGLSLDQGFMQVAPLGDDRWRVTWRKLLRFSDRTPNSGATGWADFGQMLNYLAPTALSWWVDTETYGLGARTYQAAQSQATAN